MYISFRLVSAVFAAMYILYSFSDFFSRPRNPFPLFLFDSLIIYLFISQFKRIVEEGAKTPQVTSEVPKPVAEALCEDMYGRHSDVKWPGAALNFSHAKMEKEALMGEGPIGEPF
jgi:hypothetical protein